MTDSWVIFLRHVADRAFSKAFSLAVRGSFAKCGSGLDLHPSARLRGLKSIHVGSKFRAGKDLWLEAVLSHGDRSYAPQIRIGNNVALSDNVHIAATNLVVVGNFVLMGSRILVTDHGHGFYSGNKQTGPESIPNDRPLTRDQKVMIGDRVWIGDGAVILPGSRIGDGAVIGANAVVSGEVPIGAMVAGVPARIIKRFDASSNRWETG
jgi:acetyltransferase-like isoleucine patch superfamily enzyme